MTVPNIFRLFYGKMDKSLREYPWDNWSRLVEGKGAEQGYYGVLVGRYNWRNWDNYTRGGDVVPPAAGLYQSITMRLDSARRTTGRR